LAEPLALLLVLARAQQSPEILGLRQIAERASITGDRAESLLARMVRRGWVARSPGDRYGLICDTERFLVSEVYREFALESGGNGLGGERSDALKAFLTRFAERAEDALDLPLRQLLESETA
jgi:DNA-binding IscR family transcriptional regulator